MKVLIVDDTVFMRITIRRILEAHNIDIAGEAEDGEEAVRKYKTCQPDLVVMDISMPKMDGIEAVKHIKAYDENANIIMCSLQGQRANVMEAIKAGAKSYLVKPLKEDKLLLEIQKLQLNIATRAMLKKNSNPEACTQACEAEKQNNNRSKDYTEGLTQGYLESKREIATNMIRNGIALELVMSCVELSQEEVEAFKKAYNL